MLAASPGSNSRMFSRPALKKSCSGMDWESNSAVSRNFSEFLVRQISERYRLALRTATATFALNVSKTAMTSSEKALTCSLWRSSTPRILLPKISGKANSEPSFTPVIGFGRGRGSVETSFTNCTLPVRAVSVIRPCVASRLNAIW